MTPPRAATALLTRLQTLGWTVALTHGTGTVSVSTLGESRGDGTRPRVAREVPCMSVAIRAHAPDGRALRAVWESHGVTAAGKPAWRMDMAWRGRRPDEHAPAPLRAAQLTDYIQTSGDQDVMTSRNQEMAA